MQKHNKAWYLPNKEGRHKKVEYVLFIISSAAVTGRLFWTKILTLNICSLPGKGKNNQRFHKCKTRHHVPQDFPVERSTKSSRLWQCWRLDSLGRHCNPKCESHSYQCVVSFSSKKFHWLLPINSLNRWVPAFTIV